MKFSIPNPCHQDWQKMKQETEGRYCGICTKVVVDFTQMTEQEILEFLKIKNGQKVCGNFTNSQLKKAPVLGGRQRSGIFNILTGVNARIAIMFSALMLMFGCRTRTLGEIQRIENDTVRSNNDSINFSDNEKVIKCDTFQLLGEVAYPEDENK